MELMTTVSIQLMPIRQIVMSNQKIITDEHIGIFVARRPDRGSSSVRSVILLPCLSAIGNLTNAKSDLSR